MLQRKTLVALAAAGAVVAGGTGTAVAATSAPAPANVTVRTASSFKFKINRYLQVGFRFNRDVYTVRSGGTVTFRNGQSDEPHTATFLRGKQMPRTERALGACGGSPKSPCAPFEAAHQFNEQTGEPGKPIVDVGTRGIDRPGDSVFFGPRSRVTLKVSAKKGSTLNFLCLLHPWMQAKLVVK